jgi:HEAT repeat protein
VVALQTLGPDAKQAIPELNRLLNAENFSESMNRAVAILPYLGKDAMPPLIAVLTNQEHGLRYQVAGTMAVMGTNARPAVPLLVEFLKGSNEWLACISADTLGKLKIEPANVVPALSNSIQDPRPYVRISAAEAMYEFEGNEEIARKTLISLFDSPDFEVRRQATNAVRRIVTRAKLGRPN